MEPIQKVSFFFDSDALLQILLAGPQQIFSILRSDFGVGSFMMSEVEVEVRSNRRLSGLVRPQLDKSLKTHSLNILNSAHLDELCAALPAPVSLANIRELGAEYALMVGKGEAYSHAAGLMLGMPVVSNDMNAIRTLEANGKTLPPTILRSYDLLGFLYVEGYLAKLEAEQALKTLKARSEWMPDCLRHASFEDGIRQFNIRLSTSLAVSGSAADWSAPFYLKRKS